MVENTMNILFHMSAPRIPSQTGPSSICPSCMSVHPSRHSLFFLSTYPFVSSPKLCVMHVKTLRPVLLEGVLPDHGANKHPCQEKVIWGPSLTEPELSWETHSSYNG